MTSAGPGHNSDASTAFERAIADLKERRTAWPDDNDLHVVVFEQALDTVIHWAEKYRRAVDLTLPLMEKYEGQGEGGIAEFNIAIHALRECKP